MNFGKQFKEGLITQNPVLVQLLGMCSTLAITTSLFNGIGMGVAVTIILTLSNVIISAMRKIIPDKIRIAMFIVVIAGFVTCVDLSIQAFLPDLANSLGVFIPLIVVNCIILGRAEAFSYKNGIPEDESGNGGGYVFDCRSTHNPGRYEPYKKLTGLDEPVIRFLEDDGEILDFLKPVYQLADHHVERYMQRGFTSLMFCFGCTGGQHRSVYSAQHLAEHIHEKYGIEVRVTHREQHIQRVMEAKDAAKGAE